MLARSSAWVTRRHDIWVLPDLWHMAKKRANS